MLHHRFFKAHGIDPFHVVINAIDNDAVAIKNQYREYIKEYIKEYKEYKEYIKEVSIADKRRILVVDENPASRLSFIKPPCLLDLLAPWLISHARTVLFSSLKALFKRDERGFTLLVNSNALNTIVLFLYLLERSARD